jgi:hypothetical protein
MTRDIRQRLEKLEALVPPQENEHEKIARFYVKLFTSAVAFYLGDPTPEGSIAEAHARALGYPSMYQYKNALEALDSDFAEREASARTRLLAKFGVSWDDPWDKIVAAGKRMAAGFSDQYSQYLSEKMW